MGQAMNKSKKGEVKPKSNGEVPKEAIEFIKGKYDTHFKDVKSFDQFYRVIFEIIEQFSVQNGSMQFKLPPEQDLKDKFKKARGTFSGSSLTKEQFERIVTQVVGLDSFQVGAMDVLLFIFGAPICALLAKRFIPGLKSISDDIILPVATSGSVLILAKTNKL